MKVRASSIIMAPFVAATAFHGASAFTAPSRTTTKTSSFPTKPTLLPSSTRQGIRSPQPLFISKQSRSLNNHPKVVVFNSASNDNDVQVEEEEGGGISINIPYALAYVGFLGYATYATATLPTENTDTILQTFLADPQSGLNDINALFSFVFNVLGLYAFPMACLMMPGAKQQKLPATPFLIGACLGGYGVLGIYASTWKPMAAAAMEDTTTTLMKKSDLGWFTANVLENKVFNWAVLALVLSIPVSTGLVNAILTHPGQTVQEYVELFKSAAIVSASSVDLLILTTVAASLIPDDLKRRGVSDSRKANLVALSTLLLPVFGLFTYCAVRPSMEED